MTASSDNARGKDARDLTVFLLTLVRKASSGGGLVATKLLPFSLPFVSWTTTPSFAEGAGADGFFSVSSMDLVDVERGMGFCGFPMFSALRLAQKNKWVAYLEVGKKQPWPGGGGARIFVPKMLLLLLIFFIFLLLWW